MTHAPLTISAVNHTTGTLTITGHGLITGGGFSAFPLGPLYGGALYAPSGGVIPTGLAPVTTYWPIVVDANTIKLADSNAHAMAGTALSFSTDGTLPLQFLVGLPYELPRISAAGTQQFSDDGNTAWQSLKGLWALLTGQAQSIWSSAVKLAGALTVAGDVSVGGHLKTSDPITFSIANAAPRSPATVDDSALGILALNLGTAVVNQFLPLTLPVGFVISAWEIQAQKTSTAGTLAATLIDINAPAGTGARGTTQSNSASNPGHIVLGQTGLSLTVAAHHNFVIEVAPGGTTGDFVYGYQVTPG